MIIVSTEALVAQAAELYTVATRSPHSAAPQPALYMYGNQQAA